ncbi:S-adenosyl-L-methionine-dependent methyltransferase [Gloeopeniophorella convolvens]|nr:S-adenosyl-L-methionine-dependent methyltransferase [Gloeopeniophorella convolvens]
MLSSLSSLISSNVHKVESAYSSKGIPFPSLDTPYQPGPFDNDPDVLEASRLIVAAAAQLVAMLRLPMDTLYEYASGMQMTASLGLMVDTDVPDLLKEAGPGGLHVDEIGQAIDVDSSRLARVLRHLATRHVFKEVAPNIFANNRVSSVLTKSRSLKELRADKISKYDDASGAALIGHYGDEVMKATSYMSEFLQDTRGFPTPFSLAFKLDGTVWQWYKKQENEWRHRRFRAIFKDSFDQFSPSSLIDVHPWGSLERDSVVVDVGGNVGPIARFLESSFPHLRYVVQDLPNVICQAPKFWEKESPQALVDGRVVLQEHSFFDPQPVKGAAVYLMRFILHDWPDKDCIEILTHLRAAAAPQSRLVVSEVMMQHACAEPYGPSLPPAPLLANLGIARGGMATLMDLHVMTMADGQERTRQHYAELGRKTGWKLESSKL